MLQFCCSAEAVPLEYAKLTAVEVDVDWPEEEVCVVSIELLLLGAGAVRAS